MTNLRGAPADLPAVPCRSPCPVTRCTLPCLVPSSTGYDIPCTVAECIGCTAHAADGAADWSRNACLHRQEDRMCTAKKDGWACVNRTLGGRGYSFARGGKGGNGLSPTMRIPPQKFVAFLIDPLTIGGSRYLKRGSIRVTTPSRSTPLVTPSVPYVEPPAVRQEGVSVLFTRNASWRDRTLCTAPPR